MAQMFSRTLRSKWPIFNIAAYCMLLRTLQQYMCNVNLEPFIPEIYHLSLNITHFQDYMEEMQYRFLGQKVSVSLHVQAYLHTFNLIIYEIDSEWCSNSQERLRLRNQANYQFGFNQYLICFSPFGMCIGNLRTFNHLDIKNKADSGILYWI